MERDDKPATAKQGKMRQLVVYLISLILLAAWILGLNWLSMRYTSQNYVVLYLKYGTLVSIMTAFFSLVWRGLEEQKGLLAWHPARFLASCTNLAAVFYSALAVNFAGPLDGTEQRADDSVSVLEALWDGLFAIVLNLVMGLAVLGWILIVAPLYYLLTLFTGAPARREIRGTGRRLVVQTQGFATKITDQPSSAPMPSGAIDVSFGTRPFALTNALNGAVLFVVKLVMPDAG